MDPRSRYGATMIAVAAITLTVVATLALSPIAHAQACQVYVWVDLAFGTYDPLATGNLDGTGQVLVRCYQRVSVLLVKLGTGGSGTYFPREMTNGADDLEYNIYADAARTLVWGDGTSGTTYLWASRFGPAQGLAYAYGRTALGQDVSGGAYSDTVVVTIEF